MKKDNLPVWPDNTNKGNSKSIEVFFLGQAKKVEPLVSTPKLSTPDNPPTDAHGDDMTEEEFDSIVEKAIEKLQCWQESQSTEKLNKTEQHDFCCPIGPKGHTGWKGIKLDDTIPSDFIDVDDLREGAIYKIVALGLTVKFLSHITIPSNKILIQVSRHGVPFYVEEGSLIKATQLEIEYYINDNPF